MTETIRGAEALGPRVRSVGVMPGHRLEIVFSNGERRVFDASPLLEWPAYRALKNDALFSAARVEYGTVCWPGDLDCCPDRLYHDSIPADALTEEEKESFRAGREEYKAEGDIPLADL